MFISEDRDIAHTKAWKIFDKSNIKRWLMSVYCDIKTLEGVEHSKSKRNTQLRLMFLSLLYSCSTSSIVFISQYRDMHAFYIASIYNCMVAR